MLCKAAKPSGGRQEGIVLYIGRKTKTPLPKEEAFCDYNLPYGGGMVGALEVWRGLLKSFQLPNNLMRVLRAEHITAADKHINAGSHKTRSSLALDTAVNLNQRL